MLRRMVRMGIMLGLAGVALGGLIVAGLAVRRSVSVTLPAPTGAYPVGRIITTWVDASRLETLGGSGGPREIAVWIWYPAAEPVSPDAPTAPYMPPEWARAREADRGVASLFLQSLDSIRTHSAENAPVSADGPFPALIFEPGLGPLAPEYTTLAEDLASHGFVVIGLNPTYSASVTVIEGRVITRSDQGTILDDATPEEAAQQGDRLAAIWAEDDRFAIDQIEELNSDADSLFNGKLDVQHIGLWGHSLGGAAALEACHLDIRCSGAADVDGTPFGTATTEGLERPALFIWSEAQDRSDPMIVKADRDVAAIWTTLPEGYQVTIGGTRHFNFSDLGIGFNPIGRPLGALGPIDATRGLRISADYLEAFFGEILRGEESPLLDGDSPAYPEVELQSR